MRKRQRKKEEKKLIEMTKARVLGKQYAGVQLAKESQRAEREPLESKTKPSAAKGQTEV